MLKIIQMFGYKIIGVKLFVEQLEGDIRSSSSEETDVSSQSVTAQESSPRKGEIKN